MSIGKIFEVATRTKMRFPFRGQISVEDLWDLPVQSLDSIYKSLNSQLKKAKEESLLETKSAQDRELELKIEIIKYIVNTKQEESDARLQAKEKKAQKQKILEVLAAKQDQALQNKTPEELQAMLENL